MTPPAKNVFEIPKPRKIVVSYDEGRKWRGGNHLFVRKYDGCFEPNGIAVGDATLIVERMKSPAPPGVKTLQNGVWYAAHSVAVIAGQNVLRETNRARWRELCERAKYFPAHVTLAESGSGGEFVEAVLQAGGEGVMASDLEGVWGDFYAVKRSQVFYCRVVGLDHATGSAILADRDTNEPRGKICLRGNKFDQVRGGSILKVVGFGLTAKGLIREVRPDTDTPTSWLSAY